ncbi:MAG: antitoxin [Gammaproteobacteria bacterium]
MKHTKQHLDLEEQEILAAIESGRLKSVPHLKDKIKYYQDAAKMHANKNRRVSLRMTEWDFMRIQEKALREGLAYQSLLSSIIHKYLTGQLIEHKL